MRLFCKYKLSLSLKKPKLTYNCGINIDLDIYQCYVSGQSVTTNSSGICYELVVYNPQFICGY